MADFLPVGRKPILIALGGKAQHGKTTLAWMLKGHFRENGFSCEITSFASVPKKMLEVLGLSHDQLYGALKEVPTDKLAGHTPRFAMQSLATEWGRQMLYEDIWVDAWQRTAMASKAEVLIVDDVRHLVEIERLKEMGAVIFEVYRPSKMPTSWWGWAKYKWRQLQAHSSERLHFKKHGIRRIVVSEDQPSATLKEALAIIFEVQ